jgi:hypothetical protein
VTASSLSPAAPSPPSSPRLARTRPLAPRPPPPPPWTPPPAAGELPADDRRRQGEAAGVLLLARDHDLCRFHADDPAGPDPGAQALQRRRGLPRLRRPLQLLPELRRRLRQAQPQPRHRHQRPRARPRGDAAAQLLSRRLPPAPSSTPPAAHFSAPDGRALLRPPRSLPSSSPGSCRRRQVPPLAATGFLWALFPSCLLPALPGGGAVWRSSRMARTARRRGRALGGATRERRGRRGDGAGVVSGDPDAAA